MWVSDNNLSLISHYADGNSVCDMATLVTKELKPAIIFEYKKNCKEASIVEGISQLISFGLSVWHKNKLSHALKLVLISHRRWFLITLPPFDTLLPNLKVFPYTILDWDVEEKASCVCKSNYIQFLLHLRENFQSFK